METNFNFKSQICTDRIQSERLLALGLKKETADMVHIYLNQWDGWYVRPLDVDESIHHMEIPAWSLHRLLCLYGGEFTIMVVFNKDGETYDDIISIIDKAIKEGYFNKEYLV